MNIFFKKYHYYWLSCLFFALFTCSSSYQKILKSKDLEFKEQKAKEFYAQKKYTKALPLLEDLYAYLRGTPQAESIYFLRAECLYKMEFFIEAAYHFEQFTLIFPDSPLAERALYLTAYSNFKNSPDVQLSQIETKTAIQYLQDFIDEYPESNLLDSANLLMDQLRNKLEVKMYNWADLYYKMELLGPAVEAFELFLADFPGSQKEEEVYFKMLKSAFFYARRSVAVRQTERFEKVAEIYERFNQKFPVSRFQKEAEEWYRRSQIFLGNLEG